MHRFYLALALVALFLPSMSVYAQAPTPCPGKFGCFEVLDKLQGSKFFGKTIDDLVTENQGSPLITTADTIFQYGLVLLVMVSLICVLVGGYLYMTAGGNSSQVDNAKHWIGAALAGIIIGMTGWIILNTISPQFADKPIEPKLNVPTPTP